MIQRMQSHPPGTHAACSNCKREPHHIISRGAAPCEQVDFRDPNYTTTRHTLECYPCGRSTGRHATLESAVVEWGEKYAQSELKLRVIAKRRAA